MADSFKMRCQQALQAAKVAQKETASWTECWNRIYGVGGEFGKLFPTVQDRTKFVQTAEYQEIDGILSSFEGGILGVNSQFQKRVTEASGKMVVRLPKSLHAALQSEAEKEHISMNQLIVAKLSSQLSETMAR